MSSRPSRLALWRFEQARQQMLRRWGEVASLWPDDVVELEILGTAAAMAQIARLLTRSRPVLAETATPARVPGEQGAVTEPIGCEEQRLGDDRKPSLAQPLASTQEEAVP